MHILHTIATARRSALRCNCRGYSLIEVVIAMAILTIGILAVAKLQLSAVRNNTRGNVITQATMLAEIQIERMKNVSDVRFLADAVEENLNQYGQPGGIFTRTTTISNPLGGDFSRQIEVTVQWNNRGFLRSVMLRALTQGNGI